MSISLTHGIDFSPYPFSRGLNYWSSGNGTPANDTYDVVGNSAYVPADQTFGGCLEIVKNDLIQKLRFTGQTQLMPETYLFVTIGKNAGQSDGGRLTRRAHRGMGG